MDAFGGGRVKVRPPEKGVFPLDHDGECKEAMQNFLACLRKHNQDHFPCKEYSKTYLACRMDRNLMAKESFDTLGLGTNAEYKRSDSTAGEKESKGFIAGTSVKASKKSGWGLGSFFE